MKVRYIGPGGAQYVGRELSTGDVIDDPSGLLCKKAPRLYEEVKEPKPKARAVVPAPEAAKESER